MTDSGRVGGCVVALVEYVRRSPVSRGTPVPPDVIIVAIRCYLRYAVSYHDVEAAGRTQHRR